MRWFKVVVFICFTTFCFAQKSKILYDFSESPTKLLYNPGLENKYKLHIGVPLLSNFGLDLGVNTFTLNKLLVNDNVNFNIKLGNLINEFDNSDFMYANFRIDNLYGGLLLKNDIYLSFGLYQEVDFFLNTSRDLLDIIYKGNQSFINKPFDLSLIQGQLDVLGVLHIGATKKISQKLTVGGRLKMYSSSFNIHTSNSGTIDVINGTNNIYQQILNNIKIEANTSGLVNENSELLKDTPKIYSNTFFGKNNGFGLDLGFTYRLDEQFYVTGSILDLGFISYSDRIRNYTASGSHKIDGVNFEFDPDNPQDYFGNFKNDFKQNIATNETTESYALARPTKINASAKYSYGLRRVYGECYMIADQDYFANAIGAQLNTILRPNFIQTAFTVFYETYFSQDFLAKVTYTVDNFSYTNVGLGISTNFGKVNLQLAVDNILELSEIGDTHNASINLGLNYVLFK